MFHVLDIFYKSPLTLFFFFSNSPLSILLVFLGLELVIRSLRIYTTSFTVAPLNFLGPCLYRESQLERQQQRRRER